MAQHEFVLTYLGLSIWPLKYSPSNYLEKAQAPGVRLHGLKWQAVITVFHYHESEDEFRLPANSVHPENSW